MIDSRARYFQGDVNEEWQIERSMRPVVDVIHETSATCFLVAHERKGGGEGGDEILGSTAVYAVSDGKLLLRRKDVDGEPRATLEFDSRDGGSEPIALKLDTDTLRWLAMDGGTETLEDESTDVTVLNALRRFGKMTSADLREETKKSKAAVSRSLQRLMADHMAYDTGEKRGNAPLYAATVSPSHPPTFKRDETVRQ